MNLNLSEAFESESLEHLDRVEGRLLNLEKCPQDQTRNELDGIFRALHSIKGSAGLMGYSELRDLAHAAEGLLGAMRDGVAEITPARIDSVLSAVDTLRLMIQNGPGAPHSSSKKLADKLKSLLPRQDGAAVTALPGPAASMERIIHAPPVSDPVRTPGGSAELDIAAEVTRLRSLSKSLPPEPGEKPLLVMVVEDDPATRQILTGMINSSAGFKPVSAGSMLEAQKIINDNPDIFVAVLDLNLPDAPDGEIVDLVLGMQIPGIVLTGVFDEKIRERVLAKKVVDYVIKDSRASLDHVTALIQRLKKNQAVTIMVVDDSKPQRVFVKNLLRLHRYQVLTARDGNQALALAREQTDLKAVITDYHMPGMDGITLVSKLRERYSKQELSIIGMSSEASGSLSAKFLKTGANDFLAKHFSSEELHCRITQNLELQELMQQMSEASNRDFLTRLPNRRNFFNRAKSLHEKALEQGGDMALAMIDIDYFKRINDAYGHLVGDEVLKGVARQLDLAFSEIGLTARFGGEEFCVMTPGLDRAGSLILFNEFRKMVELNPVKADGHRVRLTVSIGVANGPHHSLDSFIKKADDLLYQAKGIGRNRVMVEQ